MGLLTGRYNDADKGPPEGSRFAESKDRFAEFMRGQYGGQEWMGNVNKVKSLKPIADSLSITQSQLALAWCLKNPNVFSVITGVSRPEQILENAKCLEVTDRSTPDIMVKIDDLVGKPNRDPEMQD
jgi:aryl-alcohol dehydrogenase-like predicted oxidoreductase